MTLPSAPGEEGSCDPRRIYLEPDWPKTVIVTGPPGSGKTTVTTALQTRLPGSVRVDGDALRRFAPADAKGILGPGSTYRAAGVLARFYASAGARCILVDYVFRSRTDIDRFGEELGADSELDIFVLWADFDTLERRIRRRRRTTDLQLARTTWEAMDDHLQEIGTLVPSIEPADRVIERVEKEIRRGRTNDARDG